MRYFQYFGAPIAYTLATGNTTLTLGMTNVTQRAILRDRLLAHTSSFYDYVIPANQRPDSVATSLYGTAQYTWIVLLVNNIYSLFDWPLSHAEFDDYLIAKYGSRARATTPGDTTTYYFNSNHDPVTYVDYCALDVQHRGVTLPAKYFYHANGGPIDAQTYAELPSALQGIVETPFEYETRLNEAKRTIKVLRAQFLPAAEEHLKKLFRSV